MRNFQPSDSKGRKLTINKAITDSNIDEQLTIYLTKDPQCTSSLKPDFSRLNNFPYAPLFEVIGTEALPATSLNRLAAEHSIHFDWIKLDTQGTEHRILKSLNDTLLRNLNCCDVEISFYAHYKEADTFPLFHEFMISQGFYISDIINVQGRPRLRKTDEDKLRDSGISKRSLKTWPTSPEIRYLRSINHDDPIEDLPRLIRIWTISYVTKNYPYCFFLASRIKEDPAGDSLLGRQLEEIVIKELASKSRRMRMWLSSRLRGVARRLE